MNWQIQEAKNKLSELIERSQKEGPQVITKHGKDIAVLISADEYQCIKKRTDNLVEYFMKSPLAGKIEINRNKDNNLRKIKL